MGHRPAGTFGWRHPELTLIMKVSSALDLRLSPSFGKNKGPTKDHPTQEAMLPNGESHALSLTRERQTIRRLGSTEVEDEKGAMINFRPWLGVGRVARGHSAAKSLDHF